MRRLLRAARMLTHTSRYLSTNATRARALALTSPYTRRESLVDRPDVETFDFEPMAKPLRNLMCARLLSQLPAPGARTHSANPRLAAPQPRGCR